MNATCLLIRIYGEKSGDQWFLINLEFSLAAQADTLEDTKSLLASQIREYVVGAVSGQDRPYAGILLSRRAPAKYWIKWWLGMLRTRITGRPGSREEAFTESLALVSA